MASATRINGPRTYTSADWNDFEHTGPDTLAGRYMRTFWHPVYCSEDLPTGGAKPIRIMSEDMTLYRGESGEPHLLAFRCAHRGTQLSTGWVEGDEIRCFYHGWKYDASGQCTEQPAEPESFCQKIRIRSYPVQESLGCIFAYMGEGEPPPFPRYPRVEQRSVHAVETSVMPYNFWNQMDNRVDTAHLAFVHQKAKPATGTVFENGIQRTGMPRIYVEESEWGVSGWARFPTGAVSKHQIGMPNMFLHTPSPGHPRPEDPRGGWRIVIWWLVPIDDERHMNVQIYGGDLAGESEQEFRQRRRETIERISSTDGWGLVQAVLDGRMVVEELEAYNQHSWSLQDGVAQLGQGVLPDRKQDHLGRTDVSPILCRKLWVRELRALAEGRPLKQWRLPEDLLPGVLSPEQASAQADSLPVNIQ